MAYSAVSDLLLGDIPLPGYLAPQKYVDDAADEIDSQIGHVYTTPIPVGDADPISRPAKLLLKRVNNFLASGRILLAVATPGEESQVNAYGLYLVKEATLAIEAIRSGEVPLTDAVKENSETPRASAPLQYNKDKESNVEAFYDRIANPNYVFGPGSGVRAPGTGFFR